MVQTYFSQEMLKKQNNTNVCKNQKPLTKSKYIFNKINGVSLLDKTFFLISFCLTLAQIMITCFSKYIYLVLKQNAKVEIYVLYETNLKVRQVQYK